MMNDSFSRRGFSQVLSLGILGATVPVTAQGDRVARVALTARFEQTTLPSDEMPRAMLGSSTDAVNPNVAVKLFLQHSSPDGLVLPTYAIKLRATGGVRGTLFPVRVGLLTRRGPLQRITLPAAHEWEYGLFLGRLTPGRGASRLTATARNPDAVPPRDRAGLAALARVSGPVALTFL